MKIELPREVERFGTVYFCSLQKVFELDSGLTKSDPTKKGSTISQYSYEELYKIQKEMAVVVPVYNERLKLIEGVLCGIPHQCLIIIISNSPREAIDRFRMEQDALRDFCIFVNKHALIIHQKDPAIARAFKNNGYTSILDKNGIIRDGKAEGMIIGILMAWLAGRKYVGFVDADNYFPGSVEEYIREYATGFAMSKTPYSMVRIGWHSKPKIVESKLFFRKWGRVSENTNYYLNKLISVYTGYETEIIKTGNAGEHALTIDLARHLRYSEGYSIEPYHIVNLIEQYGGIEKSPYPEIMKQFIEVYQIESRNPHLHESGDKEHIDEMSCKALQSIYHSQICPPALKKEILTEMRKRKFIDKEKEPPKLRYFPQLESINHDAFFKEIQNTPYGKLINQKI